MNKRTAAVWTDRWLRQLSWREIRRMNSWCLKTPALTGISASRQRRVFAEWARRKREGRGGLAAS